MWQPNRRQWPIIWAAALLLVLAWPPGEGRSLLLKAAGLAVDPTGALPSLPPPLPIGLDDDGDVVAAHDAQEAEYYRVRASSALTRWRLDVKTARDPFDPQTERQLLVATAIVAALLAWRRNSA
jgi:hypothetical protein